jgi:hypothetical protein
MVNSAIAPTARNPNTDIASSPCSGIVIPPCSTRTTSAALSRFQNLSPILLDTKNATAHP